jgi:hypothetical protein
VIQPPSCKSFSAALNGVVSTTKARRESPSAFVPFSVGWGGGGFRAAPLLQRGNNATLALARYFLPPALARCCPVSVHSARGFFLPHHAGARNGRRRLACGMPERERLQAASIAFGKPRITASQSRRLSGDRRDVGAHVTTTPARTKTRSPAENLLTFGTFDLLSCC